MLHYLNQDVPSSGTEYLQPVNGLTNELSTSTESEQPYYNHCSNLLSTRSGTSTPPDTGCIGLLTIDSVEITKVEDERLGCRVTILVALDPIAANQEE